MPGKTKFQRRIDAPGNHPGGGGEVIASTPSYAPPAIKSIPEPEDLVLSASISRSASTPSALIAATWSRPSGTVPQEYVIQVSTSNTFPAASTQTFNARSESATIDGLKPNTTYYVRVAAVFRSIQSGWSGVASTTTPNDTTPAAQPTGLAATWLGTGDLQITWANPADANFREVELRIYDSNGGTHYRTVNSAVGRFVYTVEMNLADTSGTGDPSLYIEARSRTWSNVLNNVSPATLSTTKSAPATPTLSHSWSGDTGNASADLTFTWNRIADAAVYRLTLNGGTPIELNSTSYTYTLAANIAQNGNADPTITYSLVAVDGLRQTSSAASGTATNAAPATPTATLTPGVVSGLHAVVTSSPAADFSAYEYVFKRDGSTVATVLSSAASMRYEMQGSGDDGYHSWTVEIRQRDAFGQYSSTYIPTAVAFEALTLTGLRATAAYTDSQGNTPATLNALKDANTTSGGVTYPA